MSLVLGPGCAKVGGTPPAPSPPPPGAVVEIGPIPEVGLSAGDSAAVTIPVLVAEAYHVQSNPAAGEFYVPLELELDPVAGLRWGSPVYPKGEPWLLEGASEPLLVNGGRIAIRLVIKALPDALPGVHRVQGGLHYQACDARRCLFPATVPVAFSVTITD